MTTETFSMLPVSSQASISLPKPVLLKTMNQTTVLQTRGELVPENRYGIFPCYLGNRYLGTLVDELNHILRLAFVRSYEQAF